MAIVGTLPVQLANGTLADATQVMSDFNYVVTQVNAGAAGLLQANNFIGAQTIAGDAIITASAAQTLSNKTISAVGSFTATGTGAVDEVLAANITGVATVEVGVNNTVSTNGVGAAAGTAYLAVAAGSLSPPLIFGTANTERMRLDNAGNLIVGGTSGGALFNVLSGHGMFSGDSATHSMQGLYLGWNSSGGGGESNFVNQKGAGGTGGFSWQETSTANVRVTYAALNSVGFLPSTNNAYLLGGSSNRWSVVNAVLGNFSGDVTGLGIAISRSKPATTTRTATTIADDPDLIAPLAIGKYDVTCFIPLWNASSSTGGMKLSTAFSGTLGSSAFTVTAVLNGTGVAAGVTLGLGTVYASYTSGITVAASGPVGADWVRISGTVTVTVAGNFSIQWSAAASAAVGLSFGIGAFLNCTKVA